MTTKTKRTGKTETPRNVHIPAWLVIACGLAAMLLFAFGAPTVVLKLRDHAQLSLTTQGLRDGVNVDFMDVEQLDSLEKLRRVALAEENGEQLYTLTTSRTMTRDEQMTLLQNVRDRNDEVIFYLEELMDEPLLETYDANPDETVQYVVLDKETNYLFTVCYLLFMDYEGDYVQLLVDRDDYTIYAAFFEKSISISSWDKRIWSSGLSEKEWLNAMILNDIDDILYDIYQTTTYDVTTTYGTERGFYYESNLNAGQVGDEKLINFEASLEIYEAPKTSDELEPGWSAYVSYQFPAIVELIESAYGEILYETETNAESY